MAGIGFELKKLFRHTGVFASMRAFGYATVITTGPMLLGVVLLLGLMWICNFAGISRFDRELLVCMITYVLLASVTVTSFLSMVVTRFTADMLFEERNEEVLPSFWGSSLLMMVVGGVLWLIFLIFLVILQQLEGNIIYREYTDANGEIPNIPVVPGTYTFKETYAPSGYALNTAIKTFTVTADGQVHGDTVIRDEVNRVTLKKIRQNGEALAGAVFGLFNEQGDQVQEATSDADGSVVFQQIPYGRYTIRELSAPYGYHPSAKTWEVTVDGAYQNPIGLLDTVVNEDAPGRIRILKQDELDQHVIAGVRLDIYSVDEAGNAADCVAQMITNEQGIAESPDLFPADYIVMEHVAPTGYEETLWSEKITLRIVKTDSETAKGLPGTQFTITRISGLPSHNGEGDGEVVAVITTDENGIAQTPWLTWGEYEVTETVVPDDYLDGGYSVIVRIPEQTEEEAPSKAK